MHLMDKMKHIVYFTGELSVPGGIGRIISMKANWLVDHAYKVTILTTEGASNESFYKLSPKVNVVAFNINYLSVYNNKKNLIGIVKSWLDREKKKRLNKRLLELYLKGNPCDVFFSTINYDFIPKLTDGSLKIYEAHFSSEAQRQFLESSPRLFRFFYKRYNEKQKRNLLNFDRVVLLTERDKKLNGKLSNAIVIPNFITIENTANIPNYESKRVISVGRLDFCKGYDLLFKAWKEVCLEYHDWTLDIYGHGYGRESYYQNLINELELENYIQLHQPVKDIISKYLSASLYVMTSRYEGFPLVLGEAMACGLPCIAFDCNCGPAEIIKNGVDGYLVSPVGDVQKLANAIKQMLESVEKRKRMGHAAKENIQRFSINEIMKQWVDLIEEKYDN